MGPAPGEIMRTTLGYLTLLLALACKITLAAPPSAVGNPVEKAGTITTTAASITYFAQAGDTLISIARRFTGKSENWAALGKLNRIDKDSNIPIGTAILIPADLLTDEPAEASVVASFGSIMVKAAGRAPFAPGIGTRLPEGAEIDTGSTGFVTLSLPDASRISLPSNSRVRLARLRVTRYTKTPRTELQLLRGRVAARVSPLDANKGKFQVHTPYSVAGVRGTHFRVGLIGNHVVNEVLTGSVAAGHPKSTETLALASGKGNVISVQSVGPAIDLLPAPGIVAPNAGQEYSAARFALQPVAGAEAYHVQISLDQDAQNVIAESRSHEPMVNVDGIRDGNYFMHASAISRSGLEGLSRTQAFILKSQAPSAKQTAGKAPYVERSDSKLIRLRWVAQPGKQSVLQVARDTNFSWLLFTTTTDDAQADLPRPPFGTYYARVRSVNADGSVNAFSPTQAFIVTDQWVINDGNPGSVKSSASVAAR